MATVRGMGVAVMTSRCGGFAGFGTQGIALLNSEAVLLIHNDQPEVVERHVVAEQGMRPDHDSGGA